MIENSKYFNDWSDALQAAQNRNSSKKYIALKNDCYKLTSKIEKKLSLEQISAISKNEMDRLAWTDSPKTEEIRRLTNRLISYKEAKHYSFPNVLFKVVASLFSLVGVVTIPLFIWLIAKEVKFKEGIDSLKKEINSETKGEAFFRTVSPFLRTFLPPFLEKNVTLGDKLTPEKLNMTEEILTETLQDSLKKQAPYDQLAVANGLPMAGVKKDVVHQFIKDVARKTHFHLIDGPENWENDTYKDSKERVLESLKAIERVSLKDELWEPVMQALATQTQHNTLFFMAANELTSLNDHQEVKAFNEANGLNVGFSAKKDSAPIKIKINRDDSGRITHLDVSCTGHMSIIGRMQIGDTDYVEFEAAKNVLWGQLAYSVSLNEKNEIQISNFDFQLDAGNFNAPKEAKA